ncbi:MAG: hypothetical protein KKB70_06265 [Proteobacteria bacterium]|nr:hypothetical protein [Pseudomonadota bacterium]
MTDELKKELLKKLCSCCDNAGFLTSHAVDSCNCCEDGNFWEPREIGEPRVRYEYQKDRAKLFKGILEAIQKHVDESPHALAANQRAILDLINRAKAQEIRL